MASNKLRLKSPKTEFIWLEVDTARRRHAAVH